MLTIGSLFSGIGGLELGLEWAGLGPVRWQVERDEFCRRVLAKHWPGVRRYDDVRTVGAGLERVDVICGGFPCQDVSSAGSRAGLSGSRSGLWREFARIVSATSPSWVVVENVASGATRWVDAVVRDLAERGYAALPIPLSGAAVGAPHKRARVFVVARHVDGEGQPIVPLHAEVGGPPSSASDLDRDDLRDEPGRGSGARGASAQEPERPSWRLPEPDMVRVVHGVPRGVDRVGARIRALGNSVIPQCAQVIGHVIRELTT